MDREDLERTLELAELKIAFRDMHPDKATCPDGFTIDYYLNFKTFLNLPHLAMYNVTKEYGGFPQGLDLTTIVVLHKPGCPPEHCSSCCPISLINTYLKLFCKVLANRLLRVILTLIHPEQCDFWSGHSTRHCIRKVQAVLADRHRLEGPDALMLQD